MDVTLEDRLVGRLLDGRYRVESRIARGGMASVYLAVDTRLDRTVAVKVMHAGLASDDEAVTRFIREAKSAARLSHPNVVAVYDQGTDQADGADTVFLAMEHVEGRTLRDLLYERGRLTPRQALEVLEPVLAALGAAHAAGIIHRDVKPENVLLADDGRVKVADFGLARAVSASTSSGATQGVLIGTVAYLSPEQVEGGAADARSDVYAAGILLFEMLTGVKPHDGESAIQVAYRHVHEDVTPPSARRPGLPADLDALVLRATSRDPQQRPADATRLLADVVAVRRSLPVDLLDATDGPELDATVVLRPDGLERTMVVDGAGTPLAASSPARRRHRGRMALLLVLSLLVATVAGAGWYVAAGPGSYTPTPSLLGLAETAARERATQAGLELELGEPQFSEDVRAGQVISTEPAPNADVRREGTVVAVLSRGPERYAVPEVVGEPRDEAEALLAESNLVTGDVGEAYSETVPAGNVIAVTPDVGERLRRDTVVELVVSRGRQPLPVEDFEGEPAERARAALSATGFEVTVERRHDEDVARGRVLAQTPASGSLFRGDTVALVVSDGPPPVRVPDVRDRRVGEARRILTEAGFRVQTRGTRILNRVIVQSPGSGTAPKGSTVTLTTV